MWSKNKRPPDHLEGEWVRLVKLCPCAVCGAGGGEAAPSDCHEPEQGLWFGTAALCRGCHKALDNGVRIGIWAVYKMTEARAVAKTVRMVYEQLRGLR